ncbi:hypothetical protein ID866_5432 [Astraeus odoratus]|nr:hypothetical protein ID866_5432 [Astraeus odoratus]
MERVTQAQIELGRPEKQEQEQLRILRISVRNQTARMEEIVPERTLFISRLPNEIISWILRCSMQNSNPDSAHLHRKRELAGVCRHWRDIILHTPSFWTFIKVTPTWSELFVNICVTRSRHSFLDIEVCSWEDKINQALLLDLLNILVPCAHRWRSFSVLYDVAYPHRYLTLARIECLNLPSLTHVFIVCVPETLGENQTPFDPVFLHQTSSPHLDELFIGGKFVNSAGFKIPATVRTLSLEWGPPHFLASPGISFPRLTILRMSGDSNKDLILHPNSIWLPVLEEFECLIMNPTGLLRAIVAPKLYHFIYDGPAEAFIGLESKFSTVGYLSLYEADVECDPDSIWSAFPCIHHLDVYRGCRDLFREFKKKLDGPDRWQHLKSLTLCSYGGDPLTHISRCKILDCFVAWLTRYRSKDPSKFRVKFDSHVHFKNWDAVSTVYRMLHGRCIIEWEGTRFMDGFRLSGATDGTLSLVRLFHGMQMRRLLILFVPSL